MDRPSLIDRVAAALFGAARLDGGDEADRQLIADTIDLVVDAVEPRVKHRALPAQRDATQGRSAREGRAISVTGRQEVAARLAVTGLRGIPATAAPARR
jgi:hypothetical protein